MNSTSTTGCAVTKGSQVELSGALPGGWHPFKVLGEHLQLAPPPCSPPQAASDNLSAASRPSAKAELTCKVWRKSESLWDLNVFEDLGLGRAWKGLDPSRVLG